MRATYHELEIRRIEEDDHQGEHHQVEGVHRQVQGGDDLADEQQAQGAQQQEEGADQQHQLTSVDLLHLVGRMLDGVDKVMAEHGEELCARFGKPTPSHDCVG